jgi:hypothetical protein
MLISNGKNNNVFIIMISQVSILLLIIIFLIYDDNIERLNGCMSCDSYKITDKDNVILNSFVWPYSGTSCVNDIRVLEKDRGVNPNAHIPLISGTVGDFASTTN